MHVDDDFVRGWDDFNALWIFRDEVKFSDVGLLSDANNKYISISISQWFRGLAERSHVKHLSLQASSNQHNNLGS